MDYDDGITNTILFTRRGPMHPQGLGQMGTVAAGEDAATATATAAISNFMTSNQTPDRGMPSSTLWRAHAIQTAPIGPLAPRGDREAIQHGRFLLHPQCPHVLCRYLRLRKQQLCDI